MIKMERPYGSTLEIEDVNGRCDVRCFSGGDAASAAGPVDLPSVSVRTPVKSFVALIFGTASSVPGCPTPGSVENTGAITASSGVGDPTS